MPRARQVRPQARRPGASTTARFAFVELDVAIDVILAPPPADPDGLFERAERDCFVGASLSLKPRYEWRLREPGG